VTLSNLAAVDLSGLSLAFQLGGGSELGNNTAVLSNFIFGTGGAAGGTPFVLGGASGDLTSGVTITDSDFANIFIEGFTYGDILQFDLFLTTNVDAGGTPDSFIWSILDTTLSPIPTTSTSALEPLLAIDLDSANPIVFTFSAAGELSPDGRFFFFSAPQVVETSEIPEPSAGALGGLGLLGLGWAAVSGRLRGGGLASGEKHTPGGDR
jgi:hypothetical protein